MIGEANLRSAMKMLPSVYSVSEPVYPVSEPVYSVSEPGYSVSEPGYSASEPEGGDFSPVDLKPEPAFRSASLAGSDLSSVSESVLRPERSEEHTSELQSRGHLVCRLLLEKKKKLDLTNQTVRG